LLVCISLCSSVFAGDYCLSSGQGFDCVVTEAMEFNSASPSSNESLNLSLLTLLQAAPMTDRKVTLGLNAANACYSFKWKSKTSDSILDTSFVNGQGLAVIDVSSSFEELLPANVLWTLGQYEILWSFTNSPVDKNAAAQNTFADKWILHAIRIVDSTTSGILAAGTGLLKQI
jgi:hypothetical protein